VERITLPPVQNVVGPLAAIVGIAGVWVILRIILAHADDAQLGVSHLAKYVVVVAAIVNGLPVPMAVVPQLPLYHVRVVPEPPVAVRTILPPSVEHKLFLSTDTETGSTGAIVTLITTLTQADGEQFGASHLAK
jgi:hypothetical protein